MLNAKISFQNALIFLFSIFPISFLVGNLFINLSIIIISIVYLLGIFFKKVEFKINDKFFLLLILFFITLLINLFFSNDISLSYPRVLKFFFIIFFVLAYRYLIYLENNELNYLYKLWSLIFAIVCIDLIFEFFVGFNLLGSKSYIPGRLAGFMGGKTKYDSELVIGNYFFAFALLSLSYFYKNYSKNKILNISLAITLILISFFIGERSNFAKTTIAISLFVFFIYELNIKQKFFSIIFIVCFFALFLNLNPNYKVRYIDQQIKTLKANNFKCISLNHCDHYKVAINIFKNNPFFGVGIKNFRIESFDIKYEILKKKADEKKKSKAWTGGSTHPHQIHLELLSETGIFGYLSFLILIFFSIYFSFKSYLLTKNIYQFSAILFIVASLIPFLPSGSFFTTYSSGLFWINYAIMVGHTKKLNNEL